MNLWDGIQVHIPVNSGKTVEILILAPAAAGPLEYLGSQFVFSLFQIGSQFKFRRGEAVFTVSHKAAVEPQRQSALCSLEGNENPLTFHSLWHFEIFYIAGCRIECSWNFSRFDFLMAFPRVLDIGILRHIIPLHLNVGRHPDVIPAMAIVGFFFKSRNGALIIFCIVEFPQSIQALLEAFLLLLHIRGRGIIPVI